jgi:uncharacterized protein (TIGR00251 family)
MPASCTIEVRLRPGAKQQKIETAAGAPVAVWVTSPPVDGKANRALVELLADALDVPKSFLEIVRGHTAKHKVVAVAGLSRGEAMQRLSRARGA